MWVAAAYRRQGARKFLSARGRLIRSAVAWISTYRRTAAGSFQAYCLSAQQFPCARRFLRAMDARCRHREVEIGLLLGLLARTRCAASRIAASPSHHLLFHRSGSFRGAPPRASLAGRRSPHAPVLTISRTGSASSAGTAPGGFPSARLRHRVPRGRCLSPLIARRRPIGDGAYFRAANSFLHAWRSASGHPQ